MAWGEARPAATREVEVRPGQVVVVLDVAHVRSLVDLLEEEKGSNPWEAWVRSVRTALDDAR